MANDDVLGFDSVEGWGNNIPSKPKIDKVDKPLFIKRGKEGTEFSETDYDIGSLSYPNDVTGIDYGGNYVVFYINVSVDSKFLKDEKTVNIDDFPTRDRGSVIAVNRSKYGHTAITTEVGTFAAANAGADLLRGGAAGAVAGVSGVGILSKFGKLKSVAVGAAGYAGPALIGVAAAGAFSTTLSRAQKRLKTAICLHIPNQLAIRYSANWGEDDTLDYQMASATAAAVMKVFSDGGPSALGTQAQAILGSKGLSSKQGAAASAAFGLAANPKKEQIFKNVDFRTFAFDYQFFPRDDIEASNVLDIIRAFKFNMHPEFADTGEFLYIYPSEFDITYYTKGSENMNLHRHTSCVLTEMNINYTPNGQFVAFANGMPTQINITLSFRELSLLDKDKIKIGL